MQELVYSAKVLARVAEAADGFRDGQTYYFAVNAAFPRKVTAFDSEELAKAGREDLQRAEGGRWVIVGPCCTPEDKLEPTNGRWTVCTVTVEKPDGGTYDRVWTNDKKNSMDALFFSVSAMDKFVFPYYTALYGPDAAAKMRALYADPSTLAEPCLPLCHDPKSDECACEEGGGIHALLASALSEEDGEQS